MGSWVVVNPPTMFGSQIFVVIIVSFFYTIVVQTIYFCLQDSDIALIVSSFVSFKVAYFFTPVSTPISHIFRGILFNVMSVEILTLRLIYIFGWYVDSKFVIVYISFIFSVFVSLSISSMELYLFIYLFIYLWWSITKSNSMRREDSKEHNWVSFKL